MRDFSYVFDTSYTKWYNLSFNCGSSVLPDLLGDRYVKLLDQVLLKYQREIVSLVSCCVQLSINLA